MKYVLFVFLYLPFSYAFSDSIVVGQKNKAFVKDGGIISELTISVGDTIQFKNEDSFFHNVFSLSDAIMFDLGSFPEGEHREVVFDSVGDVEVECAIHPDMKVVVHVK